MKAALIVHGGAKKIEPHQWNAHRRGCLAALDAGWRVLKDGGSALDAVEASVRVLEADSTFNAGIGSALNADGIAEMDAAVMESETLQVGAVAALQGVRHPISVARHVMGSGSTLLVGEGARRFALQHSPDLCAAGDLVTEKQRAEWLEHRSASGGGTDTIGAVALDSKGVLAASTSTGGVVGKTPGRVGDSPLPGCGFYAAEEGATALSGDGEEIMRVTLASYIIGQLRDGAPPDAAAEEAIRYLEDKVSGEAGCVVLDQHGRVGWAHNTEHMSCAWRTTEAPEASFALRKEPVHA